jgi:hypothetical protein
MSFRPGEFLTDGRLALSTGSGARHVPEPSKPAREWRKSNARFGPACYATPKFRSRRPQDVAAVTGCSHGLQLRGVMGRRGGCCRPWAETATITAGR